MITKKAQAPRLLLGMIILLFGALGILFWGLGIMNSNVSISWVGKIILSIISLVVLIIERVIR